MYETLNIVILVGYPFIERGQMTDSNTTVSRNTDPRWSKFMFILVTWSVEFERSNRFIKCH